ncbi:MAG: hypothetical protein MI742_12585 [Desulfobacterales bacterium]|nr:hypothetical protein [Desulfobacterales bacterium]
MNQSRLTAQSLPTSEVSEKDEALFFEIISTDLTPWQKEQVLSPPVIHHRQEAVMALHWHPEFIPMDLIQKRLDVVYPNSTESLVIPTQHNDLLTFDSKFWGVEVDCFASRFNCKVQLLLHFAAERIAEAHVLRSMLSLTGKYRSSQLFDFMESFTKPRPDRLEAAARETGADDILIAFVQAHVSKVESLLQTHWTRVPTMSVKNKLLKNWFDALRPEMGDLDINRAQSFLKAVKERVKSRFPHSHFYRASEIIEEVRGLGGGIIIPHPEEFWPILLAGYDVDGIETWNPQSRKYTEFLISVVHEANSRQSGPQRKQLIFMGDDCHLSEKIKPVAIQDKAKASREVGYQPAWEQLSIRKRLVIHGVSRRTVIAEYRDRLNA